MGKIIFTSRSVPFKFPSHCIVRVYSWTPDEALRYVSLVLEDRFPEHEMKLLVEAFDGYPIALSCACSLLLSNYDYDIESLIRKLSKAISMNLSGSKFYSESKYYGQLMEILHLVSESLPKSLLAEMMTLSFFHSKNIPNILSNARKRKDLLAYGIIRCSHGSCSSFSVNVIIQQYFREQAVSSNVTYLADAVNRLSSIGDTIFDYHLPHFHDVVNTIQSIEFGNREIFDTLLCGIVRNASPERPSWLLYSKRAFSLK